MGRSTSSSCSYIYIHIEFAHQSFIRKTVHYWLLLREQQKRKYGNNMLVMRLLQYGKHNGEHDITTFSLNIILVANTSFRVLSCTRRRTWT